MTDNEKWNFLVEQHLEFSNCKECEIQEHWEKYFSEIFEFKTIFNEIDSQRVLHIGSSDREIPDIILKRDCKDLFIVELKQYSYSRTEDFEKQLLNYMAHTDLRLSIGVLVCEKLYLYFYTHSDNNNVCLEIPFEEDNKLGIKFVELFSKNNFNEEKAKDFIQTQSKNKNDIFSIKKEISPELIKQLLKEHFSEKYDENIVESALKDFSFNCSERKINSVNADLYQNASILPRVNAGGKNFTQFRVNGKITGGKCPTVYYVIENYVDNNPGTTFDQLQEAFPDAAAKPEYRKLVRRFEDVEEKEWNGHRFNKTPIVLSDGQKVAVSTQWAVNNMKNFIRYATALDFEISAE